MPRMRESTHLMPRMRGSTRLAPLLLTLFIRNTAIKRAESESILASHRRAAWPRSAMEAEKGR